LPNQKAQQSITVSGKLVGYHDFATGITGGRASVTNTFSIEDCVVKAAVAPNPQAESKKPLTLAQLVLWRENVIQAVSVASMTGNPAVQEQVIKQANDELASLIDSPVSGVAVISALVSDGEDKLRIFCRAGSCNFCFIAPRTPETSQLQARLPVTVSGKLVSFGMGGAGKSSIAGRSASLDPNGGTTKANTFYVGDCVITPYRAQR
jgi:hypothetical protein